jgi:hypothetical protein
MTLSYLPRITFGIIVLNGEPFVKYNLRALYPFAHEIIVVEGGHENARSVCTPDGHSIDDTLETLRKFKKEEDPEDKVQIVTRDGFWPTKDELGRDRTPQSRAYAERATGDYLWQVDIDEFYQPEDIVKIIGLLENDRSITTISFQQITFWGGLDYLADSWALRRNKGGWHRIFKWGSGYRYLTHEPPTVLDKTGRDLKSIHWVDGKKMRTKGIFMYHYSLLFPWQVEQKARIYQDEKPEVCGEMLDWAAKNYFKLNNPFRVHNLYRFPSWLERFKGVHPPEIERMMTDVYAGRLGMELRRKDDIEAMISTWWYPLGRIFYKTLDYLDRCKMITRQWISLIYRKTTKKLFL